MECAGVVLAGGGSTRMGQDKAFLQVNGQTLVQRVAGVVLQAAGNVTICGPKEKFAHLGFPVIEDLVPGKGPLSGIHAALCSCDAAWILVAACDMPNLTVGVLNRILDSARAGGADIVMASGPDGLPEPLCAAYSRACRPWAHRALLEGRHKITAAFEGLRIRVEKLDNSKPLENVNTPDDWAALSGRPAYKP